ncbi:MAG: DUF3426 domain-containing protein [Kiloniellaceae bacterium]
MHLTCPSCDTTFLVDPDQLGRSGRRVRCGSCGHDWHQARPAEAEPAAPDVAAVEPPGSEAPAAAGDLDTAALTAAPPPESRPAETMRADRAPRRGHARLPTPPRGKAGSAAAVGWILFLLVVLGLAAGVYFGRQQIVAAVPAAAELYRLVGMPVAPAVGAGLELREVKSVRRLVKGERVVVVEGLVANVSDRTRNVPRLRASLTDANGAQVEEWTFATADATLPPGGVTGFETSTKNAPREGSLSIEFVAPE